MVQPLNKSEALARVTELVASFSQNESDYIRSNYNETQCRTEFISPLLQAFGWDVYNTKGLALSLREVIEEATVEVGEEKLSKKPDYELRLAKQRKLFIEAKKPHVKIETDKAAAFQTRRYGYSASLPISILTNFRHIAIYDCISPPKETDAANVARIALFKFEELAERLDELWPLLSRESVYSGEFDQRFAIDATRKGSNQFDDLFLKQVRKWREKLAVDIHKHNQALSSDELTYAAQLFLSRIIFLRICEDREIEQYETLKNLPKKNTFAAFMEQLKKADEFYNSGLFKLLNDAPLKIEISDDILLEIMEELYYPRSPYTFAVVETAVLGEIYEQFLGDVITITNGQVAITTKPEVRESGGVVPTPKHIVDAIVERTLLPKLSGKGPSELKDFTVADICCGSGAFLLSVFDQLMDHYLAWYQAHTSSIHGEIYEVTNNQWRLSFEEKRHILLRHIRGVDIDSNAVEVARFSLLLKLIERETFDVLKEFVDQKKTAALPSLDKTLLCGNSLVSLKEWKEALGTPKPDVLKKINAFDWNREFPKEMSTGGFDAIVANPPYIRIQTMNNYSSEEVAFYQSKGSPYSTGKEDNFDKYELFVERALMLLNSSGRLGVIIPHKFMNTQAGKGLRVLISENKLLEEVIHFGVKPVFGKAIMNYTCILILAKGANADTIKVEYPTTIEAWRYGKPGLISNVPVVNITASNWELTDTSTRDVLENIRTKFPKRLGKEAEIFVGLQTSKDKIYIAKAARETASTVYFSYNQKEWPVEKSILRPCLMDEQLYAFKQPQANSWMIFPYVLTDTDKGVKANLIQPKELKQQFPGCFAYLTARKQELEARNITGGIESERQFYQFGRSQSLVKFNTPKIVLPILSKGPRYAYDESNIVCTGGGNGPYYMVRATNPDLSDLYLLAVLNHPILEGFIRTNTSPFQGGYYSHGKQFIENLPLPIPTKAEKKKIEQLVQSLMAALNNSSARTPHAITLRDRECDRLRKEIEDSITKIFGVTDEELEIIKSIPIPT